MRNLDNRRECWQEGNTTVRRATRFPDGLLALRAAGMLDPGAVSLKDWKYAAKNALGEAGVVRGITDDASAGTKWLDAAERSCLVQPRIPRDIIAKSALEGLNALAGTPTAAGEELMAAQIAGDDYGVSVALTRALMTRMLPSPTETEMRSVPFSPIRLVAGVMLQILEMAGETGAYLSPVEMASVVMIANGEDACAEVALEVLRTRKALAASAHPAEYGVVLLRRRGRQCRRPIAGPTLLAYADVVFGYYGATTIFECVKVGPCKVLRLRPGARALALAAVNAPLAVLGPLAHLDRLCNGIRLPWEPDNRVGVFDVGAAILGRLADATRTIEQGESFFNIQRVPAHDKLTRARERALLGMMPAIWSERVDPELDLLEQGKGGDDRTWRLEWLVFVTCVGLLGLGSIENEIHEARGCHIGTDLKPVRCAPSGVADFGISCGDTLFLNGETTLAEGDRQFMTESLSVRGRCAETSAKRKDSQVYSLLVAPSIDPNVAEVLSAGIHYLRVGDIEARVVPLTIRQFRDYARASFARGNSGPEGMRAFLDSCWIAMRGKRGPEAIAALGQNVEHEIKRLNTGDDILASTLPIEEDGRWADAAD